MDETLMQKFRRLLCRKLGHRVVLIQDAPCGSMPEICARCNSLLSTNYSRGVEDAKRLHAAAVAVVAGAEVSDGKGRPIRLMTPDDWRTALVAALCALPRGDRPVGVMPPEAFRSLSSMVASVRGLIAVARAADALGWAIGDRLAGYVPEPDIATTSNPYPDERLAEMRSELEAFQNALKDLDRQIGEVEASLRVINS